MTANSRWTAAAAAVILGIASASAAIEDAPRFFVTSGASALVTQGLAAAAPASAASFQEVPAPGIRFVANEAQATTAPWIDSNGWRFQRGLKQANYAKLPAGSAALAAAEAFTFDAQAILNPDAADVEELGRMLQFLKPLSQPALPPLANVGVVDDGSPLLGEVLNLLTRRNLLYRVVSAPDPSLNVTVQLGTADFPREAARNPYEFAARVRSKLGDDNRLVRLYGTSTMIARLTGDKARTRLHLLSFGGRGGRQGGGGGGGRAQQTVRVRVRGRYEPMNVAAFGAPAGAALADVEHPGNATEFTMPGFTTLAVVDLKGSGL